MRVRETSERLSKESRDALTRYPQVDTQYAPNGVRTCGVRYDGWICTRPRGHSDPLHVAHGADIVAAWVEGETERGTGT